MNTQIASSPKKGAQRAQQASGIPSWHNNQQTQDVHTSKNHKNWLKHGSQWVSVNIHMAFHFISLTGTMRNAFWPTLMTETQIEDPLSDTKKENPQDVPRDWDG